MHLVVAASKGVFMPAFAVAPPALPPSIDAVLRPCELAARRLALAVRLANAQMSAQIRAI